MTTTIDVFNEFKTDPKFFQLFKERIEKLKTNISHREIKRLSEKLENCNPYLFDQIFTLNSEEYTELQNKISAG